MMINETAPIRTLDGSAFLRQGTWRIDPGHADVSFIGKHMMFTKVRGRFTDIAGSVVVGDTPADSTVDVTIGVESVDSGNQAREEHLRSPDLFDAHRFPHATYHGRVVDWSVRSGIIEGDLTIRGRTRPVQLEAMYEGYAKDPWGGHRAVFSARTRLNCEDFGMTRNMLLETGGLLVSKEIDVEVSLEAVLEEHEEHEEPGRHVASQ